MKYIKKDVNKTLLVLIIFFLVLFLFFTVYYEAALRKILNIEGQDTKKLTEITAQSILEKLNASENIRKYALMDRAALEDRYSDLVIQHENLKNERMRLEDEIVLLKSQIEYKNVSMGGSVSQFRLIQDKNGQIKELKYKIEALCLMLKNTNFSAKECV